MMALFRHIYDLPYEHLNEDPATQWQFMANVYIAADKYEVEGLTTNVVQQMKLRLARDGGLGSSTKDFLAAVKLVFDSTASQNNAGLEAMVDLCVYSIRELNGLRGYKMLLSECDGLAAKILAHDKLSLMLEGTWVCGDDEEHRGAEPRCPSYACEFPTSFVRAHRHERVWECPCCDKDVSPVCTEHHDADPGIVYECRWVWEE